MICQYFLSFCRLSFHTLDSMLWSTKFNFDEVQFIFFLLLPILLVSYLRNHQIQGLYVSLQECHSVGFILFKIISFISLFLAALGLHCSARALSGCSEQGLLVTVVLRLLGAVASLLQSVGSRRAGFSSCDSQAPEHRLSSCDARAQLLLHAWDLPGPGVGPCTPCWQVDSYPLHHHGVP